jgi:hypothetical protein
MKVRMSTPSNVLALGLAWPLGRPPMVGLSHVAFGSSGCKPCPGRTNRPFELFLARAPEQGVPGLAPAPTRAWWYLHADQVSPDCAPHTPAPVWASPGRYFLFTFLFSISFFFFVFFFLIILTCLWLEKCSSFERFLIQKMFKFWKCSVF